MRVSNFFGMSYHFTPRVLDNINNVHGTITTTVEQEGNKVLFFNGTMPSDDTVYNVGSESELMSTYGADLLMEITDLKFAYTYNLGTKKKLVKKLPVDAIETTFINSGTIGWAAIIMKDDRTVFDATSIPVNTVFTEFSTIKARTEGQYRDTLPTNGIFQINVTHTDNEDSHTALITNVADGIIDVNVEGSGFSIAGGGEFIVNLNDNTVIDNNGVVTNIGDGQLYIYLSDTDADNDGLFGIESVNTLGANEDGTLKYLVEDDIILFTDSIGQWGEDDKPIIIDSMTGVTGDKNVFKDFSLILRDSSINQA